MATQNWDWVFHTLGWVLAGVGVLLGLWALFWDRSRGRKRCPKCWYSMEGIKANESGGYVCPECGEPVRAFYRTRQRRRWAVLATLLTCVSYFVWVTPRILRDGWPGLLPTTLIIAGLDWLVPVDVDPSSRSAVLYQQRYALITSFRDDRVTEDTLWTWQRNWLESTVIRHMHSHYTGCSWLWSDLASQMFEDKEPHTPELARLLGKVIQISLRTRDEWPAGVPLRAFVEAYSWQVSHEYFRLSFAPKDNRIEHFVIIHKVYGSSYVEDAQFDELKSGLRSKYQLVLPALPNSLEELTFEVTVEGKGWDENDWTFLRRLDYTIPIRTTKSVHEIMEPTQGEDVTLAVSRSEPPHLSVGRDGELHLQWDPLLRELRRSGATLGVRIEVLGDGEVLYTASSWWVADDREGWALLTRYADTSDTTRCDAVSDVDPAQVECWSIRITGDPLVAIRRFDRDLYWADEVILDATFGEAIRMWRQDFQVDPSAGDHPSVIY